MSGGVEGLNINKFLEITEKQFIWNLRAFDLPVILLK